MRQTLLAVLVSLTFALTGCAASAAGGAGGGGKPNILFILSDDQRTDTIHALGNPVIRTPNLDTLCARGTAFTQAHIMGGLQGAVCVPSRAMIVSSRTLFRCPEQPRGEHALWPATFGQAGYRTFQTGKWHNGGPALNLAFQDSKNTFLGGMSNHTKIELVDYQKDGKYTKDKKRIGEKYDAEIFTDTAVEFIKAQIAAASGAAAPASPAAKPWFLWLSYTNPHDPRTPPGEFATMYDPAKMPLPRNFMPTPPVEPGVMKIRDEVLTPQPRKEADVRKEIADYYGSISHMDAQIGRVLKAMEETGQMENTIIVFAGDNGLAIGSHGLLGKQNVYEHSVGVPMIVCGPGVPKNVKSEALVYLLDIFPSTCELAGVEIPKTVEGKSFAPVFRNQPAPRSTLFFAYTKLHRGVRDARWKLIEWRVPQQPRKIQLFDLQTDPDELKDLAGDPACAGELKRMTELLVKAKEEYGDTNP